MGGKTGPLTWIAAIAGATVLGVLLLGAYAAPRMDLPWRGSLSHLQPEAPSGGERLADGSLQFTRDAGVGQYPLHFQRGAAVRGRFLHYRWDAFPPTLRLAFGWRTRGEQGWRWVPVPVPRGRTTVDLARLSPEWTGEASATAFSVLPAGLLPADAVAATTLRLNEAALETDARAPALAALLDEWLAYHPWSGRSINTGGFDLQRHHPLPLQGFVLLLLVPVVVVAWLLLRRLRRGARFAPAAPDATDALNASTRACRRPTRFATLLVLAIAAGWLLLDAHQIHIAWQRSARLAALDAAAPAALAVEPRLAAALASVRAHPALSAPDSRLVVFAASPFLRSWPPFALAPTDAAALPVEELGRLRRGALVLRLGNAGTLDDARFNGPTHSVQVETLQAAPGIALLRLAADPEPLP